MQSRLMSGNEMIFDDAWMDIQSVPRDGRLVWVGDPEAGKFVMRWNAIGNNDIFQPDPVGIWEAPDDSMTWSEDGGFGPTFWKPYHDPRALAREGK